MSNDGELSPQGAMDASVACPYLGLVDDADSHATFATDAHRCYRLANPTRIAAGHQDTYCLTDDHVSCPVYLGEPIGQPRQEASRRGRAAAPAPARPSQRPARTRREPGADTLAPRPRSGGIPIPYLTIGALALAAVVLGLAIWIQGLGGDDEDGLSPSETLQTQTALRTRQAGTPTASASTTQSPGGSPTTGPSPSPTGPAPSPTSTQRTYTVVEGDFCSTIADEFDVSLEDLLDANPTIDADCSNLAIGQVVVIP